MHASTFQFLNLHFPVFSNFPYFRIFSFKIKKKLDKKRKKKKKTDKFK